MRLPIVFRCTEKIARLMVLPTAVCETQKVEGLRLSFPSLPTPFRGIAPELDQAGSGD